MKYVNNALFNKPFILQINELGNPKVKKVKDISQPFQEVTFKIFI